MAITAIDMITDAFRLVNVIDENETPSAEQGVKALRTLNQLMGQWDRDGIKLGWQVVEDIDDTLPIDYQDERAVKFNLAAELAGEYGIEPSAFVVGIAADTYGALAKAHARVVESELDVPLEDASYYGTNLITTGGL